MLNVNDIRENTKKLLERLEIRNFDAHNYFNEILALDSQRKETQTELDAILSNLNQLAKEIGELYKTGEKEQAENKKAETATQKETSKTLTDKLHKTEESIKALLVLIPNAPDESVPKGNAAKDNEIVKESGNLPNLEENALPHWELADKYKLIDFELGAKITGSGFPVYRGKGARLQRALISFFLDKALEAGYTEYQPPVLINPESGYGTGQLPDKDAQMYHLELDKMYLSPTAEVQLTNLYRDDLLKIEELPIKMVAYAQCFRREAGSYGKDVKGLNRLHQFDKVEIVQIQHPDNSYSVLEEMTNYVAGLLDLLELPYRVAKLCSGDMGFTSALTYDMEVYSGGQQRWLEVSSISNFESFQANRLNLRFKEGDKKATMVHTLNGSALALPRIVAALLENNQTKDGIKIPAALVDYTGFNIID
ncbi:MAG: serine--tRNA ligase [Bacteroidetes bacterium]|nr:MAG: serine--tRNA ligase [Bacteroidota bacterium]